MEPLRERVGEIVAKAVLGESPAWTNGAIYCVIDAILAADHDSLASRHARAALQARCDLRETERDNFLRRAEKAEARERVLVADLKMLAREMDLTFPAGADSAQYYAHRLRAALSLPADSLARYEPTYVKNEVGSTGSDKIGGTP